MNVESQNNQISSRLQSRVNIFRDRIFAIVLILIIVSLALILYNSYLNSQLKALGKSIDDKFALAQKTSVKTDISQLDKRLDDLQNQQQVFLDATGNMVNYLTFTFTVVGIVFVLISGYFIFNQQKSQQREDEGWEIAKSLLELVTESQQFVVQVQNELKNQQKTQEEGRNLIRKELKGTVDFVNDRANIRVTKFARDSISGRMEFVRLVDISNRIDSLRFQLPAFDLSLNLNCYFLKAVYEYIIGNYNAAKNEFDSLIKERSGKVLDNNTEKKQLSLCYYYRGLIDYNIQEDLLQAEEFMNLAIKADPEINGPDIKSMILRAEINFKLQKPEAFNQYKDVAIYLEKLGELTEIQKRRLSDAYLGMAHCRVLKGGKKFLPSYYGAISQQTSDDTIIDVIEWLSKSSDSHVYTLLTLAQLAVVFEKSNRNIEKLESSNEYYRRAFSIIESIREYETKEETRAKILAYSAKLLCEKALGRPIDNTVHSLEVLLNDQELQAIYSIFSKANVSKAEYRQELNGFGLSM